MARKTRSRTRSAGGSGDSTQAPRDSAQKIWLAGLGAFERAKTEGPRVFEALVEQGRVMGARAVGMADQALKTMRETRSPGGSWDKLEQAFEQRVARSLGRLGVLTRGELDELARQVRDLNENLQGLRAESAAATRRKGRAGPAPGKKRAPSAARGAAKGGTARRRAKAKRARA